MPAIIIENVRSALNVWNIIRTAEWLWLDIIISGYTPTPSSKIKVTKASLWAENNVKIFEFRNTKEAIQFAKSKYGKIISLEKNKESENIQYFKWPEDRALILWNEVSGVLDESLRLSDAVLHIPMNWNKESYNVWHAAAMAVWDFFVKKSFSQ
jgi:tRNA G18 (ribose-2'-O)-methylase SpoU